MKKHISRIVALATVLFAVSASAEFIPVPTLEEAPLRLFVGVDESNNWITPNLLRLGGRASVVFGVGSGFDIGLGLHGGAYSDKLFQAGATTNGLLGGDVMLRFLGNVTDMFFLGIQAQAGYTYKFGQANLQAASHIPVNAGLVFGLSFVDAVSLYLFPAVNFGEKTAAEVTGGTTVWGSMIGLNVAVGAWINMGGTNLVIEAKPRFHNVTNMGFANTQFATDFMLGLGWDL